ncbi:MAG: hypothetical protein M1380_09925, partial [Chloroflexi bacterium]|nr:hypothetical protein [Chloroflexota bacterium]
MSYDQFAYPAEIQYTGNDSTGLTPQRKVIFNRSSRNDRPARRQDWNQCASHHAEEKLDNIEVKVYEGGAWQLVREYQLNYTDLPDSDPAAPRPWWHSQDSESSEPIELGKTKLLLREIVPYGRDGTTALPSTSFSYYVTPYLGSSNYGDYQGRYATWKLWLRTAQNGYGGSAWYEYQSFVPGEKEVAYLRRRYRVTKRELEDGLSEGLSARQTYTYGYGSSHQVSWGGGPEFRGHEWVSETDAAGDSTTSYFHSNGDGMDDVVRYLKGKRYRLEVRAPGGTMLKREDYDWSRETLFQTDTRFIHLDEVRTCLNGSDASCTGGKQGKAHYWYDTSLQGGAQYGNVTNIWDYKEDGNVYRQTQRTYYPNANAEPPDSTPWILDKVASEAVYAYVSPSWVQASSTLNIYDSNTAYNQAPTKGDLVRQDRYRDAASTITASYEYDSYGNRTKETDPNNHSTTTTYEATYHTFPTAVANALSQTTNSSFDAKTGRPLSVTDPNAAATSYEYDTLNRLTKVIKPGDDSTNPTRQYTYNTGAIVSATPTGYDYGIAGGGAYTRPGYTYAPTKFTVDTANLATHLKYGLINGTTYNALDTRGHYYSAPANATITRVRFDYQTDYDSSQVYLGMDIPNNTDYWKMDKSGANSGSVDILLPGVSQVTFGLYAKTGFTYSGATDAAYGRIYNMVVYYSQPSSITASERDSSSDGKHTTTTFYDGMGRVAESKSEFDATKYAAVANTYDNRGQKASQTVPFLSTGAAYATPPAGQAVTGYAYDALGRTTVITNTDGATKRSFYSGWTTTAVDENNHQKAQTADPFGRLAKVEEYTGAYPSATLYATTSYSYDVANNLTQVTDAAGNVSTMGYDWLGRKTAMSDADMYNWAYGYDRAGNLTGQTDARGQSLIFAYDELNRLRSTFYPAPGGLYDGFGAAALAPGWSWYVPLAGPTYTLAGSKLSLAVPGDQAYYHWTGTDQAPQLQRDAPSGDWEFHSKATLATPGASAFHSGLLVYFSQYDVFYWGFREGTGLQLRRTGSDILASASNTAATVWLRVVKAGSDYYFDYSLDGQGWTTAGRANTGTAPLKVGFISRTFTPSAVTVDFDDFGLSVPAKPARANTYDDTAGANKGIGRRTGMADESGSAGYRYDERGRLTSEAKTITGAGTYTTSYSYDSLDRVVTTAYPDGEAVTNTYN